MFGTRKIVGWAKSQQPNAELVLDALKQAIKKQQPDTTQLLYHSDQGVQYSANCFVGYLNIVGITQSMIRRGNCWDNVMERFFRSLKTERLNQVSFINNSFAAQVVEQYIHFYNFKRLHSTLLGYITPAQKKMELINVA